jgi:integrase
MGVRLQERDGKGWYVIINWKGQRRTKFFGRNKALAKSFRDKIDAKLKLGCMGIESQAGEKIEAYAERWLERIQHSRKASTCEDYRKLLTRDILPMLKGLDLGDVSRDKVKAVAFAGLRKGQSPKTVQNVVRCLSSLLSHAKEDGLIRENTALCPGKFLPKIAKRKHINPFTREEVAAFLEVVQQRVPRYYTLFLCAVRSGLRQGELLALQWQDLDYHGRFIEVQRNYARGRITTPKSGESRRVDMSRELAQAFRDLYVEHNWTQRQMDGQKCPCGSSAMKQGDV